MEDTVADVEVVYDGDTVTDVVSDGDTVTEVDVVYDGDTDTDVV